MRVLVVGNVFGSIDLVNYYAKYFHCDSVFSTGNLGLFYPNEISYQNTTTYAGKSSDFKKYVMGKEKLFCPIYSIRGRFDSYKLCEKAEEKDWFIENFKMLKNGEKYEIKHNGETLTIGGLGGRYSSGRYKANTSSYEFFTQKDFEKLTQNTYDIVLLHDVIGGGSSKRIIFGQEVYDLCNKSRPKFIFLGQYDYQGFCHGLYESNFAICPGITKGFYILDTQNLNLFFTKQIYYK